MLSNSPFIHVPGRVKVSPAECILRVKVHGLKAHVRCNIIALNEVQTAFGADSLSLCLATFRRAPVNRLTAIDVSSSRTYYKKLIMLLRQALSSRDALHFDELRSGRWTCAEIEHGAHITPHLPAFTLVVERQEMAVFSQIEIADSEKSPVAAYGPDVLAMPLGDLIAGALNQHLCEAGIKDACIGRKSDTAWSPSQHE